MKIFSLIHHRRECCPPFFSFFFFASFMLTQLKTTLSKSYRDLTVFALAAMTFSSLPVFATQPIAGASQPSADPRVLEPGVERNCVFRYSTDNSTAKAVNLRTVTEITMDKTGQISVQTINGTRDISIFVPVRQDKLTFLQGVLYQWERCIATR